jgi:pyrroline-5-carboxylate reductase
MKLGIIGVGHLVEALLKGLLRAGLPPADILLSPRGKGPELARGAGFALAAGNTALVAECDTVLLAVRPADAAEAVSALPWRPDQLLVSACAGVPIAALERAGVTARIVRIMPIIAAQYGVSPTLVYPVDPALAPLLDAWGSTIALEREAHFEVATTSAAIFGWVQALIGTSADWSADEGLPRDQARRLVAETFLAAARMVTDSDTPIPELLDSIATPGGITEAGLNQLRADHVEQSWRDACAMVLRRLSQ